MRWLYLPGALVLLSLSASGQDGTVANPSKASTGTSNGTKHAVLLCGLSGDADHHVLFAGTTARLHNGLTTQLGFDAANIHVLSGDEPLESDVDVIKSADRGTKEKFEQVIADVRRRLKPEDSIWVIVLVHAHYNGRLSWLNLPGPDIDHVSFAKLFDGMTAAQQVFFITTPVSGYFTKSLSSKGRVVITATQADWETNETDFPHELARVLSSPPAPAEQDFDKDGAITLFDVYLTTARNVAQSYVDRTLLATEHPTIDDNGDGASTELQIDFLTEEQGGRSRRRKKPVGVTVPPGGEGQTARSIKLQFLQPAAPMPTSPPEVKP
jgi:hypothetical protein